MVHKDAEGGYDEEICVGFDWLIAACGGDGDQDGGVMMAFSGEMAPTGGGAEAGTIEGPDFTGGDWSVGSCGEELFLDVML